MAHLIRNFATKMLVLTKKENKYEQKKTEVCRAVVS